VFGRIDKQRDDVTQGQTESQENRTVYEVMSKNTVQSDPPQTTTWRVRIPCWMPTATSTLSHYTTLIAFLP
jgi:hypothetical protein